MLNPAAVAVAVAVAVCRCLSKRVEAWKSLSEDICYRTQPHYGLTGKRVDNLLRLQN